jgi:DNA-binding CsgD family transcriptional regulator
MSVQLSPSLRLQAVAPDQYSILRCYFPDWHDKVVLPGPLGIWVRRLVSSLRRPDPSNFFVTHVAEAYRGKLYAHLVPETDGFRIEFFEVPAEPDFSLLRAHGLTARECEVLHWLAQGKRSAEIATIISASPRTVDKHAERLRLKLAATSRSAVVAAARARLRVAI